MAGLSDEIGQEAKRLAKMGGTMEEKKKMKKIYIHRVMEAFNRTIGEQEEG